MHFKKFLCNVYLSAAVSVAFGNCICKWKTCEFKKENRPSLKYRIGLSLDLISALSLLETIKATRRSSK